MDDNEIVKYVNCESADHVQNKDMRYFWLLHYIWVYLVQNNFLLLYSFGTMTKQNYVQSTVTEERMHYLNHHSWHKHKKNVDKKLQRLLSWKLKKAFPHQNFSKSPIWRTFSTKYSFSILQQLTSKRQSLHILKVCFLRLIGQNRLRILQGDVYFHSTNWSLKIFWQRR